MKATKRFSTLELVTYRLSNSTKTVSFDTLDEDEVDEDEETICSIINTIRDNFKEEGTVDIDRIKTILKDDNYTSIKIID